MPQIQSRSHAPLADCCFCLALLRECGCFRVRTHQLAYADPGRWHPLGCVSRARHRPPTLGGSGEHHARARADRRSARPPRPHQARRCGFGCTHGPPYASRCAHRHPQFTRIGRLAAPTAQYCPICLTKRHPPGGAAAATLPQRCISGPAPRAAWSAPCMYPTQRIHPPTHLSVHIFPMSRYSQDAHFGTQTPSSHGCGAVGCDQ